MSFKIECNYFFSVIYLFLPMMYLIAILACGMKCDNSINACLDLQKWKIMSKLGQMSCEHDVLIFKWDILIF